MRALSRAGLGRRLNRARRRGRLKDRARRLRALEGARLRRRLNTARSRLDRLRHSLIRGQRLGRRLNRPGQRLTRRRHGLNRAGHGLARTGFRLLHGDRHGLTRAGRRNVLHGGAGDRGKARRFDLRADPLGAAVLIALMIRKEGGNPLRSQIRRAEFAGAGHNDRVGQNNSIRVGTSLQIAQQSVPLRDVVGEVGKRLHDTGPRNALVGPSRVGVELLVVRDERLHQDFAPLVLLAGIHVERPNLGHIDLDHAIHETLGVPDGDELKGLSGGLEVGIIKVGFHDSSSFEPFANTCLSFPFSGRVRSLCDPAERSRSKRIRKSVILEDSLVSVVVASRLRGVDDTSAIIACVRVRTC
mmetsp:Transcript_8268/g.21731  ORF Transcript_8268/g.21731 Transcript_8268/m.21731 type:complete len:357 (+) Transcript_8268:420-1490(+)